MTKTELLNIINNRKDYNRSAWNRGVNVYCSILLDSLDGETLPELHELKSALLNGADSWNAYSYGGCALIYDGDIAETLCSPSELKKTKGGERNPNSRETWLDVQARALMQAYNRIRKNYAIATA